MEIPFLLFTEASKLLSRIEICVFYQILGLVDMITGANLHICEKKKHERKLGSGSVYDSIKGLARDALGPLLNEIGVLQQL